MNDSFDNAKTDKEMLERHNTLVDFRLCPRCGEPLRENLVMNSRSRLDNKTYICSQCGTDEAMFNWRHPNKELPPLNKLAICDCSYHNKGNK